MHTTFWYSGILTVGALACSAEPTPRTPGGAGLETVFDSTGDSVVALVTGEVSASALRRVIEEWRVAPTEDDTSLFTDIYFASVDLANRVWAYDHPTSRIFRFDAQGQTLGVMGRRGGGPGEMARLNGMAPSADSGMAIWDAGNARVSLFGGNGTFVRSVLTPAGYFTSDGLFYDRLGRFYLKQPVRVATGSEVVGRLGLVRLDSTGVARDTLVPTEPNIDTPTYLAGGTNARASAYSRNAPQASWAWHPDGFFVTAHGGRYEVLVAKPGGKPIVIRRLTAPIPISSEERADDAASITWELRQTVPEWTWNGPPVPKEKAPLGFIRIDRTGRIWASVTSPSERLPNTELALPRNNAPPPYRFTAPNVWEVFETSGRFLGRVELPRRASLVEADGDDIWLIQRDSDGLPAVVRGRITPPFAR